MTPLASIEHLLEMPSPLWTPPVPVERLAAPDLERARLRREVLAPILAAPDAGRVSHTELARRAVVRLRTLPGAPALTERTLWEWVKVAQHRAGASGRFDRLELYVDKKPHALSEAQTTAARQARAVRELLASPAVRGVSRPECPTAREKAELWAAALACHAAMVDEGLKPMAALKAVLVALKESGVTLAKSACGLYFALRRRLAADDAAGAALVAGADETPVNQGGRPKRFDLTDQEEDALRGHRLHKGNFPRAVKFFIEDPACRPETRASILDILDDAARRRRRPSWPLSLRRAARTQPGATQEGSSESLR